MDLELIGQNNSNGKIYDLSEVTETITHETEITDQPGKLTFSYYDEGALF